MGGQFKAGNKAGKGAPDSLKRKPIVDLARTHTLEAVQTIIEIMKDYDAPASTRLAAANAILDRGYGKPAQAIAATVNVEQMSDAEIREKLPDALKRANEIGLLPAAALKPFVDGGKLSE